MCWRGGMLHKSACRCPGRPLELQLVVVMSYQSGPLEAVSAGWLAAACSEYPAGCGPHVEALHTVLSSAFYSSWSSSCLFPCLLLSLLRWIGCLCVVYMCIYTLSRYLPVSRGKSVFFLILFSCADRFLLNEMGLRTFSWVISCILMWVRWRSRLIWREGI